MSRAENDPRDLAGRLAASLPDAFVDPLADVKVGDASPDECLTAGPGCGQVSTYFCTRDRGHAGQHVADDRISVLEVWTS